MTPGSPNAIERVAVIGLGSIGMRHAKNLLPLGLTVYGHDPNLLRERELLDCGGHVLDGPFPLRGEVDAVVIATPTGQHLKHLLAAINSGFHVLVEKPIAHVATIHPLLEAAASKGQVVMVGNNLRFHHCVMRVKDLLGLGLIGQPVHASFTLSQYSDRPLYLRDGVIMNWGAHELDLARYLLGEATVIAAVARVRDHCEDMADILLHHAGGCHTIVHLDYIAKKEIRGFDILGEKGRIRCDLVHRYVTLLSSWDHQPTFYAQDSFEENYKAEIQAFLDRVAGRDVPGASGFDGIKALRLCLSAREKAGVCARLQSL